MGLLLILTCSGGYGLELTEGILATGDRQDNASLGIFSVLANPNWEGCGKARFRQDRIWEVVIGTLATLTDNSYMHAEASYGYSLGGEVVDTGVSDINTDPFNWATRDYGACCGSCSRPSSTACDCPCTGKLCTTLTPVSACVNGNVFDFEVALGYRFHVCDSLTVAPVIGYAYDRQRQSPHHASWGLLQVAANPVLCSDHRNL